MTKLITIPTDWQALYQAAVQARQRAYARYSHFAVGAAIGCREGAIYCGSNIENASSGLTVCAERVALWNAVSAGDRDAIKLAVVTEDGSTPCGACRQVLYEFAPELEILIADDNGKGRIVPLKELLPDAFTFRNSQHDH